MRILHRNSFFPTFESFSVPPGCKDYFIEKVLCIYRVQHVNIVFSLLLYTRPGFEKNSVVFVVLFRLLILFYSFFLFVCWLDFFPTIRFSNRSDYILRNKLIPYLLV